ncbi:pilus assembly protein TadG-related protein [Shimia sp. MIT1388]|uniref:pilus assembly protein TadG-related protein n=1 Tax=Shimia sp. MIT1388 TaxID=3096992 RepID=UPI00399B24C2
MKQFQAPLRPPVTPRPRALWRLGAHRFRKDEDGVMVGFSVILIIMMIMIGGIGADIMLAEMRRTQLQHTLDRAILAAADLDQTRAADVVVADYFDKAGVAHTLNEVTVSESLNHRSVSATAEIESNLVYSTVGRDFKTLTPETPDGEVYTSAEVQELKGKLPARTSLTIGASGTAEERIGNIEISMVLDVSGSMNNNSRLSNLKVAAKEFVQTMDDTTEDGTMSISIVPYAAQVSTPDELMNALTTNGENPLANCLNFHSADYNEAFIDPYREYDQTLHATWSSSSYDRRPSDGYVTVNYNTDCRAESSRELTLMQNDTDALKTYIDNMFGSGNTSIDTGMKWGTALLDPAFQPVVSSMIDPSASDTGTISNVFEGRPYDYGTNESLKIVVLMSDGQNTRQHFVTDNYRLGNSNVWYNAQEDFYSLYLGQDEGDDDRDGITDEPIYYWPENGVFRNHAYGEGTYEVTETVKTDECKSYRRNGSCKRYKKIKKTVTVSEPGEAKVISYADLWARTTPKYVADELYAPLMGQDAARSAWYYPVIDDVGYGTKDARTRSVCEAAKDNGIIVYTIGFEAPNAARVVLQDCASSDSHYFDVQGLEIRDAFAAIATSIRQLRLIQ